MFSVDFYTFFFTLLSLSILFSFISFYTTVMAGGILYPENNQYYISLDEDHLIGIKNGEEIKTDLFIHSTENVLNSNQPNIFRDITLENMRKELIISLLDSRKNHNIQIEGLDKEGNRVSLSESKKIKIQIREQLINSILNKKNGHYECSDFGNTVNFYVYDNKELYGKENINEDLKAYRRSYQ